jgi:hypothetical protein
VGPVLSFKVELYSEYWSGREGKSKKVAAKIELSETKKQNSSEKTTFLPENIIFDQ